jgi:hypothetical protein
MEQPNKFPLYVNSALNWRLFRVEFAIKITKITIFPWMKQSIFIPVCLVGLLFCISVGLHLEFINSGTVIPIEKTDSKIIDREEFVNYESLCLHTRQKYSLVADKIRTTKNSTNIEHWKVGAGVDAVNDGCLTYKERYAPYEEELFGNELLSTCNRMFPLEDKRSAFGIRISEKQLYVKDFELFLRSLIVELGWKMGIDVVLLVFVQDKKSFDVEKVPKEFQSLLTLHDKFDIAHHFPTENVFLDPNFQVIGYPAVAVYGHMSGLWFLKAHPQYDYTWNIESDVRGTGSWESILNHMGRKEDFTSIWPFEPTSSEWMWDTDKFETKDKFNSLQCVYGMSRKYFQAAEKELALGNNAFLEVFLPSVAKKHGLSASHSAYPVFYKDGTEATWREKIINPDWVVQRGVHDRYQLRTTFDFTNPEAQAPQYHEEWKTNDSFCSPATFIHPVKV